MTAIKIHLFGPDLYVPNDECGRQLASDIRLLPKIMKNWNPAMWPALFDASPVGSYNKEMKSSLLSESLAWVRELKEPPPQLRVLDAPPRLGFVARSKVFVPAMAEIMEVPRTQFGYAMADLGFGYTWGSLDTRRLCQACLRGSCAASMFTICSDYYEFLPRSPEVDPAMETMAELVAGYIRHVHQEHAEDQLERKIMDAWLMCILTAYLDILRPHDGSKLLCPDNELCSIKFRLVSSSFFASTLQQLNAAQGPSTEDLDIVTAVASVSCAIHDVCDRRHDNIGNVYYNLLTIVSVHTGLESVDILRRFCVDVWAWAINHDAEWILHATGRVFISQIYTARYQNDVLLDHLTAPDPCSRPVVDPYGDPVLNSLNPMPPTATPHNYSIRDRCQDTDRYDEIISSSIAHFEACTSCRSYNSASWQERVQIITAALHTKYTRMDCVNSIASYTILSQPEEFWWAADPAARYTGPTVEWSTKLI
ncbi:hypothetical protein Aspvir_001519 [Aspergillus viridinutans]|uniref:Uncharacterized protein n=1 Tax=Aspergillus viridinutans TaxID=75553 RepID=A0A9P3BRQ6_ASPVI|nr:uncharacterized protein Aspvir_001519 [Aspergillus viridinutans]GIJ99387.1 hypothetical protein Aspvir_001519 [Aspergillus viridinutans]